MIEWASPARWAWLGVLIPIVMIYLLKTRLRKRSVPTLLFWDQLFDEKRQRSWWQRFRHWASLLLQLLFASALVFAIVDPLWPGQKEDTRHVVIVLDNSASMATRNDEGRTRWENAVERATDVARSMRDGDELALITGGGEVNVVVGLTDFFPAVEDAIGDVPLTDLPTRINEATQTARKLIESQRRQRVIVISDFAFEQTQQWNDDDDLQIIRIGDDQDNVGITRLAVRRSLVDPIGYAAMIEVRNFSDAGTNPRLTITLDEDLIDVIPLTLEAEATWTKTILGASDVGGELHVKLDSEDAFDIDDVARTKITRRERIPVVLVSDQPSVYLESVFDAIPLIDLETTSTIPDEAPEGGFVVLNRFDRVNDATIPMGNVLVIDPQTDSDRWKLGEPIAQPIVAKQDSTSPLMPHVQLLNVTLPGARGLQIENATTLIESAGGEALMASFIDGENRQLVLSADLDNGDLPLRIAFPVLMTNSVNWFLDRDGEAMTPADGLCDAEESDLRSRLSLGSTTAERPGSQRRSVWFYVVCLALALILCEWFLYQRRVVA